MKKARFVMANETSRGSQTTMDQTGACDLIIPQAPPIDKEEKQLTVRELLDKTDEPIMLFDQYLNRAIAITQDILHGYFKNFSPDDEQEEIAQEFRHNEIRMEVVEEALLRLIDVKDTIESIIAHAAKDGVGGDRA